MLFVHEVHRVIGAKEDEFESAYRERWMPTLADTDDARLLWYLHHAHGSGPAYRVVTVTAVRSASAWEELVRRLEEGDLRALAGELDGLRYGVQARVLRPVPWSPLQEVDLTTVPVDGREHDQALFMEDTGSPYPGRFDAYVELAGTRYLEMLRAAEEAGRSLLRVEAAFRPAWGTGTWPQLVFWQRVVRPDLLLPLLGHDVPAELRGPGTWMHDALAVRDQWESRLLRTAPWSPLA